MKLVNAKIKSIAEAITRMVSGEVFYPQGSEQPMRYEKDLTVTGTPFSYQNHKGTKEPINALWGRVGAWRVEVEEIEWWELVPEGEYTLCWVDDLRVDPEATIDRTAVPVRRTNNGCFLSANGLLWRYAVPVKPEDLRTFTE